MFHLDDSQTSERKLFCLSVEKLLYKVVEGSLEVKFLTIWKDKKQSREVESGKQNREVGPFFSGCSLGLARADRP